MKKRNLNQGITVLDRVRILVGSVLVLAGFIVIFVGAASDLTWGVGLTLILLGVLISWSASTLRMLQGWFS